MSGDQKKIAIGISSCLLGNRVRYDGNHKYHPSIEQALARHYELVPFCPEMDIGLGVPRDKIQLIEKNGDIYCVDELTRKIDYTARLTQSCNQQLNWLQLINGYVFKTKSPSCGVTRVKTDYQGEVRATGQGIFVRRLIELFPDLPLIEEDEFDDETARTSFLAAVSNFQRRQTS